jgi:hypothetical protein
MKEFVDIHVILATYEDMIDHHDDPDRACEAFNTLLHMLFDALPEDMEVAAIEQCMQYCWEHWANDTQLVDFDDDELQQVVDHILASWEDA